MRLAATLGAFLGVTLSIATAHGAKVVKGPYLQDLSSRQVAVLVELDVPSDATLTVTRGAAPGGAVPSASAEPAPIVAKSSMRESAHELVVTGLTPATSYRYELALDDGTRETGVFTTAPEDDRPISFLLYGDNRSGTATHQSLVNAMHAAPGEFLVNTGDLVYDGSDPLGWTTFFQIERALLRDRCLFPAIGNHEISLPTSDGASRYARMFRLPAPPGASERWYSFRWGMARFFMLDAQDEFSSDERVWLESALAAADAEPGIVWRFAVMHHGPYSAGVHGGNASMVLARIPELLRKHKIDAVFAGHDHHYERGDAAGLRYLVSGGGGAPLYREQRRHGATQKFEATHHYVRFELARDRGILTAVRLDGSILDRVAFRSGGAGGWETADLAVPGVSASGAPAPAPSAAAGAEGGFRFFGSGLEWVALGLAAALVAGAAFRRKAAGPS